MLQEFFQGPIGDVVNGAALRGEFDRQANAPGRRANEVQIGHVGNGASEPGLLRSRIGDDDVPDVLLIEPCSESRISALINEQLGVVQVCAAERTVRSGPRSGLH
jgi:hypothetical protein